jgi:phosphohistidine phosphatase
MRLFLVRHGLATWPAWGGVDAERPLNPEGRRLLQAEGARLAQLGLKPDLILHSPFLRACQTAEIIAAALDALERVQASESLRPGFNTHDLKKLLREHAGREELMLVGHAPDMAEMIKGLTGGEVKLKEGAVALVKVDEPGKDLAGTLLWLAPAEVLVAA